MESVWDDCPAVYRSSERTGYPTQKPLSLLDRIIEASSNPGDVVFDPFCGCATTCVSAQNLRRKWIGIDISEVAATLVAERLADAHGKIFTNFTHRSDVPVRTDIKLVDLSVPKTKTAIKKRLYKEQKGICSGCLVAFEARNLDIDHIIPESKGGPSHYDNYQLLCGNCNSIKGNRPMEYLRAKSRRATTRWTCRSVSADGGGLVRVTALPPLPQLRFKIFPTALRGNSSSTTAALSRRNFAAAR